MPMISIHCPNCGQSYTFLENQAGTQFACLECGDKFIITAPQSPPAPSTPEHSPEAAIHQTGLNAGLAVRQPQPPETTTTAATATARKKQHFPIAYGLGALGVIILLLAIGFLASGTASSPASDSQPAVQQALFAEALKHISSNDDVSLAKILRKIDASAVDSQGLTLLIHAVRSQKYDLVNIILNAGANIDQLDSQGQSALFHAVKAKDAEMTRFLLSKNADVNARNGDADSCVGIAAEAGYEDIIELLVNHAQSLNEPPHKQKAVFRAIANKHDNCAKLLLRKGDIDIKDQDGNTPLTAAINAENSILARYLLAQGASPNARNQAGETPVFLAMQRGNRELISLFPPSAINLDDANAAGVTIPMLCAQAGDIQRLQQSLTDNNRPRRDHNGRNVLFYAATASQSSVDMLDYLLKQHIELANPTFTASPLYGALAHGNHESAMLLLDAGCPFAGQDDAGNNLLMLAAGAGNLYLAQTLLEKGINLLAMNKEQQTALSIAFNHGHQAVADFLRATGEKQILDLVRQTAKHYPTTYTEYQELMSQFDQLEKMAQGYDDALASITKTRQGITSREVARQSDVVDIALNGVTDDTPPQNAITTLENAIASCPLANNLNNAKYTIKQLQEKQRALLERLKRAQEQRARIAAMSKTEREKEVDDLINNWLGDMRIGRDTSHYWSYPSLSETLFSVQNWEILDYGSTYERVTVIVSSSTKGGLPIRVSWIVRLTRNDDAELKISLLSKM